MSSIKAIAIKHRPRVPMQSIDSAQVTGATFDDAEVTRCVTRRAARWRFPERADGVRTQVRYPLRVRAAGPRI